MENPVSVCSAEEEFCNYNKNFKKKFFVTDLFYPENDDITLKMKNL